MAALGILYIVLAVLIRYGKMYFLLAGYNTMSEEEKKKVDIEGLARLFFNVMLAMGLLLFAIQTINFFFPISHLEVWGTIGISVVGVVYLLIQANSDHYKLK